MSDAESTMTRLAVPLAVLMAHMVALGAAIFVLCFIVPQYVRFFESWKVELPVVTQQIMHLSRACRSYWYLLLPAIGIDGAIVFALGLAATRKRWMLSVYSHLFLLAVILGLVWVSITLCHPVSILIQG